MRAATLLFVGLFLLASLVIVTPAAAETTVTATLSAGTFTRTAYVNDALGNGVRLTQELDSFTTNPFTSSPTRWYPSTAPYWNSAQESLDINPEVASGIVYGATRCYDTDDASGCGTGTPAITDSTSPDRMRFEIRMATIGSLTGFGTAWFGIANCFRFNDDCQDNDDADVTFLQGATNPSRNFAGFRLRKLADSNAWGIVTDIFSDDGTQTTGTVSDPLCNDEATCTVVGTYVGGTLTVTFTHSSGTFTDSVSLPAGDSLTPNSIAWMYQNVVGVQVQVRIHAASLTFRTSGTWVTAALLTETNSAVQESAVTMLNGGTGRTLGDFIWSGGGTATYTPTITATTTFRDASLSTGAFGGLDSPTIEMDFAGDRVSTPVVTVASITYNVAGGGGGGGGNPPGFPPDLDFRCDALTDADWLLPTAQVGSRTVTLYDRRSEAVLVREYLIAWGDGRADIAGGLPVNHTYAAEGVYTITIRLALRTGEVSIFVARADVRGNNCSLQMFAEDLFGPLIALAALALVVAIILTAKSFGYRLDPRKRRTRRIQRGLLGMALVSFGLVLAVAVYATIIGTPL